MSSIILLISKLSIILDRVLEFISNKLRLSDIEGQERENKQISDEARKNIKENNIDKLNEMLGYETSHTKKSPKASTKKTTTKKTSTKKTTTKKTTTSRGRGRPPKK